MPVKYELDGDDVAVFRVTGKLQLNEFTTAQQKCEDIINRVGYVKILVITNNFEGWEESGGWGDWSFAYKNDPYIKKIAIITSDEWEDLIYLFSGKDLRSVPIELFEPDKELQARKWLGSE